MGQFRDVAENLTHDVLSDCQHTSCADQIEAMLIDAYDRGRADERKAVVAWLRETAAALLRVYGKSMHGHALNGIADEVERGEHVRAEGDDNP